MEYQYVDGNFFRNMPYQNIIVMIKQLLKQTDGIEIFDRLLNTPNFHLINCLFAAQNKKSLCLMRTRFWLIILSSMGYDGQSNSFIPTNRRFTWDNSIIEYQRNVIDNYLYTSRVHDLIDLREGYHIGEYEEFLHRLDFEYDNGYGGQQVYGTVWLKEDNTWLERGEYDGSEWWDYKKCPSVPEELKAS